jgi:hypothetical protein
MHGDKKGYTLETEEMSMRMISKEWRLLCSALPPYKDCCYGNKTSWYNYKPIAMKRSFLGRTMAKMRSMYSNMQVKTSLKVLGEGCKKWEKDQKRDSTTPLLLVSLVSSHGKEVPAWQLILNPKKPIMLLLLVARIMPVGQALQVHIPFKCQRYVMFSKPVKPNNENHHQKQNQKNSYGHNHT